MGTTITFRRGENDPTSGSGITLAEPVFNTNLHTFHIGLGYGITAAWVGAPISGLSADIAAGITYKIPTLAAVKNYIGGLCYGNTGAPTITQYVSSFNGLTGAVGLTNGSGIGLSVSGNTLTFSNTGVLSFNGLTGAVTGVTTGTANTFGPLQSFTSGISSAGGTFSDLTRFNAGLSASFVRTPSIQGPGGSDVIFDSGAIKLQQIGFPSNNTTRLTASSTVDQIITLPDDTGTVALTKNVVSSFNGSTGAVVGVSSVRGLTGAVGITNGSGIGLSVSGNTLTVSNTGVLSIDGGTGAITNVARTNVNNFFSANQSIQLVDPELVVYNSDNDNSVTIYSSSLFQSNNTGFDQTIYFSPTNPPNSVTFPNFSTTLAGLAGTQTFTGTNTFNTLTNFGAGISSAGGTFSALTRFTAGISASGGMTLAGTVSLNGQTFTNVVSSINGITGAINLAAGSNITITPSGLTLTIASTGGGAGFTRSINVITSSTTAGGTASVDYVYIGNTSGNINLTLPTAVSNANRYTVKNSNIGILTVLTTSSQTIDGATGYNLSKQFQAIDLLSDNSNWVVV